MHKKLNEVSLAVCSLIALIGVSGCDGCRGGNSVAPSDPFAPTAEEVRIHNEAAAEMGRFDYSVARDLFAELAEAYPDWEDVQVDLAIATLNRQQLGDSELAKSLLAKIVDAHPDNLRAYYCLGILSLDGGDPEGALSMFQHVAEADPTDGYAAYYTGQCLSQLGKPEEALAWFEKAIAIDPYLRSAQYGAFQTCLRLGKSDEAAEFRELFQKLENNPQARVAEIKYTRMGPKAEVSSIIDVERNRPNPSGDLFESAQGLPGVSGSLSRPDSSRPSNITVCDVNQDGQVDLFIANLADSANRLNVLLVNAGEEFQIAASSPLSTVSDVNAAAWGDFDNDGATDVYLLRDGPNQLWRQLADGDWMDVTASTSTGGGDVNSRDGIFLDADHDGDLDLFVVNDGPNELFNNNLDGTFRPIAAERQIAGNANSREVIATDFDSDRDVDLIVINENAPNEVYRNNLLWSYEVATGFDAFRDSRLLAGVAIDRNVDGQVELLTLGESGLLIWSSINGNWQANDFGERTDTFQAPVAASDINGDGRPEIIVSAKDGWQVLDLETATELAHGSSDQTWRIANLDPARGPSILGIGSDNLPTLWSPGPGRYPFLSLQFTGKDDKAEQMRSNRSGIGVQGAVRVGTSWFAFDTFREDSGPGQSLQPLSIGIGPVQQVDYVKMTWPDGVFQTELGLASGERHVIEEDQRQVASCPVVFAWNGEKHVFVTDVLGVAGIGFNTGFGQYGEPRPWEHLQLPPGLIQPRDGYFEIKIGEPMEEACYLDCAQLVRYEIPPGWHMVVDERFHVLGPPPTGDALFYQHEFLPSSAFNDRGEDVLDSLTKADFQAAEPGAVDARFLGRTEPHSIEMTFDVPIDRDRLYLMMDGWIEYPYSQTMFAAWQAQAAYEAPTIEAQDADGEWHTVVEQFGYMAGMPRRAVVPLDREKIPVGSRRLRIRTNVEIYFDRLSLVIAEGNDAVRRTVLPLVAANIDEVGFARRINHPQRRPDYDYSRRDPLWDTRHLKGHYTQLGEATELVTVVDDAVAIFGPGEEIELRFRDRDRQSPAEWTISHVLELNGWCKDMDMYTRDAETLDPLPVRDPKKDFTVRDQLHERFNQRYRAGF